VGGRPSAAVQRHASQQSLRWLFWPDSQGLRGVLRLRPMPTAMRRCLPLPPVGNATGVALRGMQEARRQAMKAKPQDSPGPVLVHRAEPEAIEWTHHPLIAPGEYPAYCAFARTYFDPGFRRWTCLLQWDVVGPDLVRVIARVPMWLSLGEGKKPRASRRGAYAAEWVKAYGGPPSRGDRLSPRVFTRRMARVEVSDTTKGPMPYSIVKKILRWETGSPGYPISKSHNQGRHPIKDGSTEVSRE